MSGDEKDTCVYSVGSVIDRGVEVTYVTGGTEGVMLGVEVEDGMMRCREGLYSSVSGGMGGRGMG